ncbi:MAG: bifunctional phosphopantothenoylcysteine decarboxylase/phosphopantothenate--cysteine ligase CoaBC [Acidobacteriota bacterium]|nr:bifunctional phosphopantothenoylcysteine decarboxylase/phosphopantothenate--cysteine ligase CoaBC [Bryobacteraceae bacterium]
MNVVLGIAGGIAGYKAAELTRALMERGATVQVVMTAAAQEFVKPLTFAALTGRKVITGMFAEPGDDTLASAIEHIGVAQQADVLAVAPATANILAKFAGGLADDFLATLYLAFTGPVVLAPAMNTNMWLHTATRQNLETLRRRGHIIVEPDSGFLACGMVGPGRLADPARIAEAILAAAGPARRDLEGETVLVTAGPTEEPIDPVRFLSNRSSGKMGYAIAEAAAARGARVVLVSGPVTLAAPCGVDVVPVKTAAQMRDAVLARLAEATIVVKAAAVADYRVPAPASQKLKKTGGRMTLELEPTEDILAEVGRIKGNRLLVGFAAETTDPGAEARRKLETKNCDMVVGNRVGDGVGFGTDDNEVVLALRGGETVALPRASKKEIAGRIFDELLKLRAALHATQ